MSLTLISLAHAALPSRATPKTSPAQANGSLVSEMRGGKVNSPELDQDFSNLTTAEGKYAESWDQQQRIRSATARIAGVAPVAVARPTQVARTQQAQKVRPLSKKKAKR
ncbi:MAG: hypothetical protein H7333_03630 [Bdellovibrionales bacterium]|nr:hypothetical protein [Oligoflexia bacterium]